MNKQELQAICLIVNKLGWNDRPVTEVCNNINQMVRNQQALELDCVGECGDFEETLLSIATWNVDKIASTMFVDSYQSMGAWEKYEDPFDLDRTSWIINNCWS